MTLFIKTGHNFIRARIIRGVARRFENMKPMPQAWGSGTGGGEHERGITPSR